MRNDVCVDFGSIRMLSHLSAKRVNIFSILTCLNRIFDTFENSNEVELKNNI